MSKIKSIKLLTIDYSSDQLQTTPTVFKKLAAQKILTMARVKDSEGHFSNRKRFPCLHSLI